MSDAFRQAVGENAARTAEMAAGGRPAVLCSQARGVTYHAAPSVEIPLGQNLAPPVGPPQPVPAETQVSQTAPGRTLGWAMGAPSAYDGGDRR